MTESEQYLQSIGRNEIVKLGSGEKTGEFIITPADTDEPAEELYERMVRRVQG